MQNEQTRVERIDIACGHVADIIYCAVGAGIGVDVCTKLHADALTVAQDRVARIVLRSVEAHVLQEVCQSALVFIFLYRAHTLCDIELCPVLGPVVVTDVIGQSVIQFSDTHILVDGDGRHLVLCKGAHRHQGKHQWHHHQSA